MKPLSDDQLFEALEELRPEPGPTFAAELDARVAAGFPRRSRFPSPAAALARLRALKPQTFVLTAGTALAAILAIAFVVGLRGSEPSGPASDNPSPGAPSSAAQDAGATEHLEADPVHMQRFSKPIPATAEALAGTARNSGGRLADSSVSLSRGIQERAVERSSQLTLGTEPENVGRASSEVFDVVHTYRGVVLNSRTSGGSAAHAEAEFELLIPSGKLGDAMAGFSRIAEVRSRHEATNDITAPTVSTAERLEDSQARIDSLLAQLAAAESEGEREAVERELRAERNRAASLQASLSNLDRRASLSRVSLRIVGGEGASSADEGGAWGIGDALDDAGQVLGIAAAVTLLALAVLAPVALIALLIWLGRRTYLRRARQTALG